MNGNRAISRIVFRQGNLRDLVGNWIRNSNLSKRLESAVLAVARPSFSPLSSERGKKKKEKTRHVSRARRAEGVREEGAHTTLPSSRTFHVSLKRASLNPNFTNSTAFYELFFFSAPLFLHDTRARSPIWRSVGKRDRRANNSASARAKPAGRRGESEIL